MAFSDMYGNVINRTRQSGTWATARAKDYLNKCQGELWRYAKDWKCLEAVDVGTGVVGQANYATPATFERALHIELQFGSAKYSVEFASYDLVQKYLQDNTGNGRPSWASIDYDQLWFSRYLDAAYTVRLGYISQPADMSGDADTTPYPEYILEEFATAFLLRDLGQKDWAEGYALWKGMVSEYADSDGRNPDQLVGFYDGLDANASYHNERWMWG